MSNLLSQNNAGHKRWLTAFVVLANTFHVTALAEQQRQSHQQLIDTATQFIEQYYSAEMKNDSREGLELEVKPLDSRIRIKSCDKAVEGFWPYKPRNRRSLTVGVRCSGEVRWKLYLQAKMKKMKTVAVLTTPVSAGDVLDQDMISMRSVDILTLRSRAIEDTDSLTGMKFKRSFRSGTVLSTKQLEIPATIKRGDIVEILSGNGPIKVRAQGYALADGQVNEMIKVRNSSSEKVLQAYVVKAGYVQTVQ